MSGIIAINDIAAITINGSHPSIPVKDITRGPIANPIINTVLYIVTILPRFESLAIDNIQVSKAFHASAPANPIRKRIMNHAVKLSNIGKVKYKIIVTI